MSTTVGYLFDCDLPVDSLVEQTQELLGCRLERDLVNDDEIAYRGTLLGADFWLSERKEYSIDQVPAPATSHSAEISGRHADTHIAIMLMVAFRFQQHLQVPGILTFEFETLVEFEEKPGQGNEHYTPPHLYYWDAPSGIETRNFANLFPVVWQRVPEGFR